MVWEALHAVTHLLGDAVPVPVVERPAACDPVEQFLNDPTARHNRARAHAAIIAGDWRELAHELGVTDAELDCFDTWEERDAILAQCADALAGALPVEAVAFRLALYGPVRVELAAEDVLA